MSARCAQQQQAGQISVCLARAAEDFFPAGSKELVGAVAVRKRGVENEDVASTVGRVLRIHLQHSESVVCSTGNLKRVVGCQQCAGVAVPECEQGYAPGGIKGMDVAATLTWSVLPG